MGDTIVRVLGSFWIVFVFEHFLKFGGEFFLMFGGVLFFFMLWGFFCFEGRNFLEGRFPI